MNDVTQGVFDPEQFLNTQTSDAMATSFVPIPVGEYTGIIQKVEANSFQGKKDTSKTYFAINITWDIDDEGVRKLLERQSVTAYQNIFVDLTSAGGLDTGKGKNIQLGRLREAVGLNRPGVPFSFNDLVGKVAKVRIDHEVMPTGEPVARVKAAARMV